MSQQKTRKNPPSVDPAKAIEALWRVGILSWKLWGQQLPIYEQVRSLPREIDEAVLLCARQFGKSHLGVLLAIEDCLRFHDRCMLIMGPTLKQTREIVAPRLRRICADAPPGLVRPSKSEGKWHIGDCELVMGGMDVHSGSQRGKTLQNAYIEEIVESEPDAYMDALRSDIGPALAHSDAGKTVFLTTLPKLPDHPFITETMARADLNGSLYTFTIHDNKALTREQYEACVRRAGGEDTNDWKREFLCQVIRDGSLVVVPSFDKEKDVAIVPIPNYMHWQTYTDVGGVRDLTVSLLMGYDYLNATDIVRAEKWWPINTPTAEIAVGLKEWQAEYGAKHFADAPGQLLIDLHSAHGLTVTLPQKDDWEAGINKMNLRFGARKVKVHPDCRLLITSLQSGTFNKNRTDFARTRVMGHCDALAALMYGIRTLDRTNPFPEVAQSSSWQAPVRREKTTDIASAIVPNAFGQRGMRRFGS